ncbi:T-lymphocyte surface antigen Ly-9-like isoform X2, partial [Clarias magur]
GVVNIYIATGANYTFRSHITRTIQSIQWTHDNTLVVEWDPPGNAVWYRYRNQAELDQSTGVLTVREVKKENRGVFKGQFQVNGVLQYAVYSVTVVDAVSEPNVTCEQNNTDITLICSVEPPVQAEFTWTGPDGFSHVGNRAYVTKGKNYVYYCTVKNEVSNNSAEFNTNACPKGGADNIYIATGADYTFRSHITATIQSIQWTHNSNLVVECDPPGNPDWYRFKTQAELNQSTGDLTVREVKKEDRGLFKGQFQVNGDLWSAEYSVTVVDAVSEPNLTCEQNDTDITLICSVEPPVQSEFTWTGPDGFSHVGNRAYVTRGNNDVYYCTARNEVSKKSAAFNTNVCPKDAVSEPNVTCERNDTDITLICSVEPPVQSEFTWTGPDGFSHVGNRAYVTRGNNDVYYCTVKNKVSAKLAEFNIKACPKGGAVNVYIATGADYTFRSNITKKIQSIQWTHNNNLVVECDPPGNPDWYRFKTQAELNRDTGDLTVREVKKEDGGFFKGQFQVNGVLQYAEYSVTVMDPVSKPTVTCKKDNETHSTLMCIAEAPVPDSFEWKAPDGTHSGSSVQITRAGVGSVYFCTAENKVSKKTTEFRPDSNCFRVPDVPVPGSNIGAGGIIGILLAVAVGVIGVIGWIKR